MVAASSLTTCAATGRAAPVGLSLVGSSARRARCVSRREPLWPVRSPSPIAGLDPRVRHRGPAVHQVKVQGPDDDAHDGGDFGKHHPDSRSRGLKARVEWAVAARGLAFGVPAGRSRSPPKQGRPRRPPKWCIYVTGAAATLRPFAAPRTLPRMTYLDVRVHAQP